MADASFHEVRFPLAVAFGATAGPERRTDVILLGSGHEQRNARWADSRRRYDAGAGVRTRGHIDQIIQFFEERRGRLYGFRYRDPLDHASCAPGSLVGPLDQVLGTGDGERTAFQLVKRYGADFAPYLRTIHKPVEGSVRVAVDGIEQGVGDDVTIEAATGLVTFAQPQTPPAGATITAGFQFDTPVRFDTDLLEINLSSFEAGVIPTIPIVEILP